MSNAEFDRHAASYRELHQQNIALTGEDPEYFADYKMRDFRDLLSSIGLPADGRYLDFGSGIGNSVKAFREHLPQARLVCADVSSDSLALSRQRHGEGASYVTLGGDHLPFADGEFDGAFACCVFHHIPHEQHLQHLRELRRVVKPGGVVMVYEHNPYNPLTVRSVRNCPFDENAVLLTASQLKGTFEAAGLKLHTTDYRVFFPASLAAIRPLEDRLRWLPLGAQYFVSARA